MKASLVLNKDDEIALFYDEPLNFKPEWASVDIEQGEIFISNHNEKQKAFKLDKIDETVYSRVKHGARILLIQVKKGQKNMPTEAVFVPLMIPQQL